MRSPRSISPHEAKPGLFLVLVSKAPALVWEAQKTGTGKLGQLVPKESLALRESLFLSYPGPRLGARDDQDERASAFRRASDPQRSRIRGGSGAKGENRIYQTGELLYCRRRRSRLGARSQTPCPKNRPQGGCANSASVGFIAPACVLRWTWRNRKRARFSISTRCYQMEYSRNCCSAPAGRWRRSFNR